MEAIYRELSEDIQQDINNMYHKELLFLEDLQGFFQLDAEIKAKQDQYGMGWMLLDSEAIWGEADDPDYIHPLYWTREETFWCNIASQGRALGSMLIRRDGVTPRELDAYDYLDDEWDGQEEMERADRVW